MGLSSRDGPDYVYGPMAALTAAFGSVVGDPDLDAGPGADYQGRGILDVRYYFQKDQLQGFTGKQPIHYSMPQMRSVGQIPAAVSTSNIAAAANVVSGTAMTLVSANSTGITTAIPIIPFSAGGVNNNTPVNVIAIDFGFEFATTTAGNAQITVASSADFTVGMPLVIAGAGNAGGTAALLTNVATIVDTTHITLQTAPLASINPTPIGTGNIWGPSPTWSTLALMQPSAALPWLAGGPGLFLDTRQTIARVLSITGATSGTGGTFTVKGYDIYHQPITDLITVGAGAVTGWGQRAFKYVLSVTPNFSDAHNYSVGTSDMFGIHYRTGVWEDLEVCWAGLSMTASTGFTAALSLNTTPTTSTTDVRGLIQTATANGSGTGISTNASNGTVSSLAMSGRRLLIQQNISGHAMVYAAPANAATLFGNVQV